MARFLTRSQLARVTPVLGQLYRSSLGLFSTTPNLVGNPNKHRKRMEERNEKHRKVQQLADEVVILSCESTAKGGVCDIYVVGATHHTPESCREAQAVMSYLKPEVLFLELCRSRSSILKKKKMEKYSVRDIGEQVLAKRMNLYSGLQVWRYHKYASEHEASEFYVAYQEAMKYGSKVVLGDRPTEVMKGTLAWEVTDAERDKYMAHQLLEVARKNSLVVAIVGAGHLEGIKKYWKQPIKVEDLMTIPPPNSYRQCLGVAIVGVSTIILVIYFLV